MFQDIYPHNFDNQFKNIAPQETDRVLCYSKGKALLKGKTIPRLEEIKADGVPFDEAMLIYGFSIDGEKFYVHRQSIAEGISEDLEKGLSKDLPEGYELVETRAARETMDRLIIFELIMGLHLFDWYTKTRFCGKCGGKLIPGTSERSMICSQCGNVIYPRISPVIIVGVTWGDKILLTKYADRDYSRYALIAGFMEFGETPEDTVHREVYEEAGLRVKNIRYYKSQPWPYPDSLLMGFYAEVDGNTVPALRDGELKEATWFKRSDMPEAESDFALTSELMENFRKEE